MEVVMFNCLHQFGQAIVPRLIRSTSLYVVSEGIFREDLPINQGTLSEVITLHHISGLHLMS